MPSPQRPSRGAPPRRAALHERSDSSTNERSLRMVGDPQAPIYGSPYPTKSSQILLPRGYQGSRISPDLGVSNPLHPTTETKHLVGTSPIAPGTTTSKESPEINLAEDGTSTGRPSTNASFYSPRSSMRGLETNTSFTAIDEPLEEEGRMSDDIVQLPSVPSKAESTAAYTTSPPVTIARQPIVEKDSDTSLSSANSTGTVIVKKNRDGKKRASYSAFPNMIRPSSSRSNISSATPPKLVGRDMGGQSSPVSPVSPSASVSPSAPAPTETHKPPAPMYLNSQMASESSLCLQYPVIRPPSASASWVEPPASLPQRPHRAMERNPDRWNPHLSTVPSEGTGSQSEGRSSQGTWLPDSTRVSKSSSMILNGRGSSDLPPSQSPPPATDNPEIPPLPSPPPTRQRDFTGSTIRVVNEEEDRLPNALPTIPGSRGSEHPGIPTEPGNNRYSVVTRRGSKASFFRDSIPAWARAYYARPQTSSSLPKNGNHSRPSTSTDNTSLNIFRPRTRNNREGDPPSRRNSLAIGPARPPELDFTEFRGPPRRRISSNWSPHLWHDRTSLGRRRTIFQAPSIDEQAEGKALSRRNAQVLLFTIGFVFPPGWFIASFLPLPQRPDIPSLKGKDNPNRTQIAEDLEKRLGPIDEARYENARWWRNINRIMSLVGIVIVVAVIAIAAVSAT